MIIESTMYVCVIFYVAHMYCRERYENEVVVTCVMYKHKLPPCNTL